MDFVLDGIATIYGLVLFVYFYFRYNGISPKK